MHSALPRPSPGALPRQHALTSNSSRRRAIGRPRATPQQHNDAASPDSGAASSSSCPFLAALPRPAKVHAPWGKKLLQITDPTAWQLAAIAAEAPPGAAVVQGALMLQPMVMPITGDAARTLLAGEGDLTTVGWPESVGERERVVCVWECLLRSFRPK